VLEIYTELTCIYVTSKVYTPVLVYDS